jgi:hypothetical protein
MRSTASTPSLARLFGAFALAALGTALLMAIDLLLPDATQSGLQQNAARLAILAVILSGAWFALTRARFSGRARLTGWLAIAGPLLVWQSVVWWLALAGGPVPLLPLAIVLPPLIGLPILLSSSTIGQMLDATPPAWLVGLQVYRVVGSVFLTGWLAGNLPAIPAVPAGAGDTLVGLLALPVALLLAAPARGARGVAVAWNVLGILDLVDAVALGALTTPGAPAAYPLVLIPAFGVPLSLMLHCLSLRQLRRLGRRDATGLPVRTDRFASPLAAHHG